MQLKNLNTLFSYAAISGNIIFILWVTFNGINEGFSGTLVEKFSFAGLTALLVLNTFLILMNNEKSINKSI
jgi:hypothetical protein